MIRFENVCKDYGETRVIKNLNLEIQDGSFVVFIGPSGCGKTTTLQLINKLNEVTSGEIYIDGSDIATLDPVELRRTIGYVIQEIGLFPHMTIEQNIEIVPKLLKWPEEKRKARTLELIHLVGMDQTYLSRYPASLSGGQQQRVGFLRALAAEQPIILMDEPFGALDPITRELLQEEIKSLQKKLGKTIVFVTHDMDEALKLADTIILMQDGVIVQQASPEELLSNPANEFVKNFIGKHRIYNAAQVDKVSDIMNIKIVSSLPDKGIAESVALMQHKRVNTLMIVDKDDHFMGYVTIEHILGEGKPRQTIEQLIQTDIPVVAPGDSARDAFDLMITGKHDILAVVGADKKLAGVVTKTSMVKSLAGVVWKEDELA